MIRAQQNVLRLGLLAGESMAKSDSASSSAMQVATAHVGFPAETQLVSGSISSESALLHCLDKVRFSPTIWGEQANSSRSMEVLI